MQRWIIPDSVSSYIGCTVEFFLGRFAYSSPTNVLDAIWIDSRRSRVRPRALLWATLTNRAKFIRKKRERERDEETEFFNQKWNICLNHSDPRSLEIVFCGIRRDMTGWFNKKRLSTSLLFTASPPFSLLPCQIFIQGSVKTLLFLETPM